jgi:hypothetical protein
MYGYQGYGYQPNYQQPNYMQRQYAPQPSQMPQNQQQVFTPIQTPPPMETPIQDIKFVNRAQAEAYIVFPNTKVMLIDTENGMAYIKTADGMGQTQTDYFRFDKVNADGSPIKPQEPIPKVNFDEFIKKEDLEKFGFVTVAQYNELAQKLEQMQKRLEGARTNVGQPKQSAEARM